MLRWYPSLPLRIALDLTFAPVAFLSILAVNCVADANTPWTNGPLQGSGVQGDFIWLALVLAIGWLTLVLGWRGARHPFHWLLAGWQLAMAGVLVAMIADSGELVIHGESVGLRLSLTVLGPLVALLALGCATTWIVRDVRAGRPRRTVAPFSRRNRLAVGVAALGLVGGTAAFAFDYEELGCALSAVAMLGFREVMRPNNPSDALRRAFVLEGSARE